MKGHKLLADNQDHFVVQHPDGSNFKIAKKMIDPLTHKKISDMDKAEEFNCGGQVKGYDEGGDVEPQPSAEPVAEPAAETPTIGQDLSALGKAAFKTMFGEPKPGISDPSNADVLKYGSVDQAQAALNPKPDANLQKASTEVQEPKAPVSLNEVVTNQPRAEEPKPVGPMDNAMTQYETQAKNTLGAVQSYADTAADTAAQIAESQNYLAGQLKQNQMRTRQDVDALNSKAEAAINEMATGKINPNQYWENKGAGGKIMAAVALAIGGIGAGLTGGRNLALDTINKQIDNDLEAQKANLNQKNNLYSKYLDLTKNKFMAEEMTKSDLLASSAAQIAGLQAKNIGPEAKLRAEDLKSNIMNKLLEQHMSIAKYQSNLRLQGLGTGQGATAADLAINPEMQARAVPLPSGHVGIAYNPEDAKELRTKIAQNKNVFNLLDRLQELGPKAAISPEEKHKAKGLMASLKLELAKSEDFKKFSEPLMENIEEQFGDPTKWSRFIGLDPSGKTSELKKTLQDEMLNNMSSKLMNYSPAPVPRKIKK